MKPYILFFLLFSILFYSQNSNEQIIKEKIKQIGNLQATNKTEEKKIISLSNDLYYISKSAGNKEGMIVSLQNLATIYLDKGEISECIKVVSEGIILSEESKKHRELATLLNIKAYALLNAGNYGDSRINFSKSLKVSDLLEDKDEKYVVKTMIYQYLVSYADAQYRQVGDTNYKDSIVYFAKKGYEEALKISEKRFPRKKYGLAQSARLLGEVLVKRENYKEAEKYFQISENLIKNADDNRLLAALYNARGVLEFKKGNSREALENYKKALQLSMSFHYNSITIEIYNNFIEYYKKTGDTKQELYYVEKSKILSDSLSSIHKSALIIQSREDIRLARKEQSSDYKTWAVILTTGIVFLASLFLVYFYRKAKNKKHIITGDLYYSPEKANINEDKIALLLEMAKNNDKQFLIIFQEVYSDLYKELLKFSQLTSADLEMCAYLKLSLQTKEIAMYKKVSIGAVDNRKYRIRKKLNLPPESDLYKWINTIKS